MNKENRIRKEDAKLNREDEENVLDIKYNLQISEIVAEEYTDYS